MNTMFPLEVDGFIVMAHWFLRKIIICKTWLRTKWTDVIINILWRNCGESLWGWWIHQFGWLISPDWTFYKLSLMAKLAANGCCAATFCMDAPHTKSRNCPNLGRIEKKHPLWNSELQKISNPHHFTDLKGELVCKVLFQIKLQRSID